MKKEKLNVDDVYKILKKFVEDEVHGGDFDQGNSLEDTMSVFEKVVEFK